MNINVARSLNDHCIDHVVEAREIDINPIKFAYGPNIVCWSPALLIYENRMTVPFVDYRKTYSLSKQSINFIFSLQNEAIRTNNPDYHSISLEIIKFKSDKKRTLYIVNEAGFKLFSYEELDEMISFTQSLWISVCEGRTQERRASGGSAGSLL